MGLRVVCAVALMVLAGGCSSGTEVGPDEPGPSGSRSAGSPPEWDEPADYSYVVERRCEGKESLGTYRVEVAGGQVSTVTRTDGKSDIGEEEGDLPTLSGLVRLAETAAEDGAEMTVTSDLTDGHPILVAFDVSEGGTNDDNTCFHVTQYRPS
jgi:hypothetical protein